MRTMGRYNTAVRTYVRTAVSTVLLHVACRFIPQSKGAAERAEERLATDAAEDTNHTCACRFSSALLMKATLYGHMLHCFWCVGRGGANCLSHVGCIDGQWDNMYHSTSMLLLLLLLLVRGCCAQARRIAALLLFAAAVAGRRHTYNSQLTQDHVYFFTAVLLQHFRKYQRSS